jgi:hypothetical protein
MQHSLIVLSTEEISSIPKYRFVLQSWAIEFTSNFIWNEREIQSNSE